MKRVLVTGGAGFIGSHIAKALAEAGYEPVVFDNLSLGHAWAVKWGPLVQADLLDRAALDSVFRSYALESVIHTAGSAYVGESVADPKKYFRNNIVTSLNLLDAMIDHRVGSIVFSSSCTTYGLPQSLPLSEQHPQSAISPYGETKLLVERAMRWYGDAYGLKWAALRYFNAAGADPDGQLGEEHAPETHLIPLVIAAALGGDALRVFGVDYPTPDGTAIRDYIHVTDLAKAHVAAVARLSAGHDSMALNLGTGQGHSIYDVIRCVERVSGRRVPHTETSRRAGDPPALVADASRALAVLGWRPELSDLDTIVGTAWRWFHDRRPA